MTSLFMQFTLKNMFWQRKTTGSSIASLLITIVYGTKTFGNRVYECKTAFLLKD